MQGGFVKFRKKQACITLINSLIWGLAAALLAVGALLLTAKLNKTSLQLIFYVLIPIAAFIVAAGVCYLLSRQKDKKLAKRLDEEFALGDRVQTMIEFQDGQTAMIRLQRKDAQARLDGLSASKFKWKGLWACVAALTCAAAVFVAGLIVPKTKAAGNDTPPKQPVIVFEITNDQKTKLATLIKNVKESKAEDGVKTAIVTELDALQLALEEIDTADALYTELVRIILVIDGFVENHNTYKRVYEPIRASEVETVQQFAIGIGLNDFPTVFEGLKTAFQNEEKNNETVLAAIAAFTSELKARFAEVLEKEDDLLMLAIPLFIADMETVAALDPSKYSYDKVLDNVSTAFNDNVRGLTTALEQQTDNRAVTSNTIEQLISIFNLPPELIPDWGGAALEGLGGSAPQPDEPPEHGDGIIVDGIVYPSNETVYDYYTKVICEYGKVFEGDAHNYKKQINMLISECVANGTISPEVEEMLRTYLDALSGSEAVGKGD